MLYLIFIDLNDGQMSWIGVNQVVQGVYCGKESQSFQKLPPDASWPQVGI